MQSIISGSQINECLLKLFVYEKNLIQQFHDQKKNGFAHRISDDLGSIEEEVKPCLSAHSIDCENRKDISWRKMTYHVLNRMTLLWRWQRHCKYTIEQFLKVNRLKWKRHARLQLILR